MAIVTKTQFAKLIGRSRPRIYQLIRRGMPVLEDGRVDAEKARRWLEAHIDTFAETQAKKDSGETHYEAQRRKEIAIADLRGFEAKIRELELDQKRGQLVDVGAVEKTIAQMMSIYRQRMLCVAPNIAPLVAVETDIARCHAIIEASVYEALEDFSRTEFEVEDPVSVGGGQ